MTHQDVEFCWNEEHQSIFDHLKTVLTTAPLLHHPDYDYPFIIQCDASDKGIGAVLSQVIDGKVRVIQYISRPLREAEKKWTVREKEALAILWACESFRPFIIGTRFLVETDHQSLKWLMEAKSPA